MDQNTRITFDRPHSYLIEDRAGPELEIHIDAIFSDGRRVRPGEIGYLGEGMFKSPRFFQTDFSIMKKTKISETSNIEFRAEFFNLFNNANFIVPQTNLNLDAQQFGRITDTFAPRFAQLTMRVNW